MGKEAAVFLLWTCWPAVPQEQYDVRMWYYSGLGEIYTVFFFATVCSAVVCIRGSWSIPYRTTDAAPEVGLAENFKDYCTLMSKQLSSTWHFGARDGGKGVQSSPG